MGQIKSRQEAIEEVMKSNVADHAKQSMIEIIKRMSFNSVEAAGKSVDSLTEKIKDNSDFLLLQKLKIENAELKNYINHLQTPKR